MRNAYLNLFQYGVIHGFLDHRFDLMLRQVCSHILWLWNASHLDSCLSYASKIPDKSEAKRNGLELRGWALA